MQMVDGRDVGHVYITDYEHVAASVHGEQLGRRHPDRQSTGGCCDCNNEPTAGKLYLAPTIADAVPVLSVALNSSELETELMAMKRSAHRGRAARAGAHRRLAASFSVFGFLSLAYPPCFVRPFSVPCFARRSNLHQFITPLSTRFRLQPICVAAFPYPSAISSLVPAAAPFGTGGYCLCRHASSANPLENTTWLAASVPAGSASRYR